MKIINSSFYRCGPIDYLREEPYGHVFLTVTRDGGEYNPPSTELGIVSTDQCSVCKFPESFLIFLANLSCRIQPHRPCKQRNVIQHQQQLKLADNFGDSEPAVIVPEAIEPEKYKHEKGNNGQEDNE